jgi:hypothetical protein
MTPHTQSNLKPGKLRIPVCMNGISKQLDNTVRGNEQFSLSFEVKYMIVENVGVLDFNRRYENLVSPLVLK